MATALGSDTQRPGPAGLSTRVTDSLVDTVQAAGLRFFALRGEKMARLLTPKGLADPYPLYEAMRAEADVVRSERFGFSMVLSYDLVTAVLRDARFSADNRTRQGGPAPEPGWAIQDHEMMLRMDDPDHARVRRLVSSAFTPRAVASWRPLVERLSDELLSGLPAAGFDLIDDYAVPLTVQVICELLGVPSEDWRSFRQWGEAATATMGAKVSRVAVRHSRGAMWSLFEYLAGLIEEKRRAPADDLLSVMIAAEEEGDRLTDRELIANSILILLAGFETTVNLIGNGTVALLGHPTQFQRLAAEPELVPNGVEELLRYDGPVQFTSRIPTEDVELGGHVLAAGQEVGVMLGAANNDPFVFSDPRRLDVRRANARHHVALSGGGHYCLGAALARVEGTVAFTDLTRRFPALRLAGRPRRRPTDLMRGYEHVGVAA